MLLEIDVGALKLATAEAIKGGKAAYEANKLKEAERYAAENEETVAIANNVLGGVAKKCAAAAMLGKNSVVIMKESVHVVTNFVTPTGWTATITRGPGLLVIKACQGAGLKVSTVYADDGVGMNSWAEIVVSW